MSELKQAEPITDQLPIQKLSCMAAMRERRGDVVCFTPALLLTHGRFPLDPLNEFVARFNIPAPGRPFCVEIRPPTLPFFSGLGVTTLAGAAVDWDRRLYAIPQKYAKSCVDFLGGIGIAGADFVASSVTYEINVPDPTMPQFNAAHMIPVTVFGILLANKITYLEPNGFLPPFVKTIPKDSADVFQAGLDELTIAKIKEQL